MCDVTPWPQYLNLLCFHGNSLPLTSRSRIYRFVNRIPNIRRYLIYLLAWLWLCVIIICFYGKLLCFCNEIMLSSQYAFKKKFEVDHQIFENGILSNFFYVKSKHISLPTQFRQINLKRKIFGKNMPNSCQLVTSPENPGQF